VQEQQLESAEYILTGGPGRDHAKPEQMQAARALASSVDVMIQGTLISARSSETLLTCDKVLPWDNRRRDSPHQGSNHLGHDLDWRSRAASILRSSYLTHYLRVTPASDPRPGCTTPHRRATVTGISRPSCTIPVRNEPKCAALSQRLFFDSFDCRTTEAATEPPSLITLKTIIDSLDRWNIEVATDPTSPNTPTNSIHRLQSGSLSGSTITSGSLWRWRATAPTPSSDVNTFDDNACTIRRWPARACRVTITWTSSVYVISRWLQCNLATQPSTKYLLIENAFLRVIERRRPSQSSAVQQGMLAQGAELPNRAHSSSRLREWARTGVVRATPEVFGSFELLLHPYLRLE